MITEFLTILKNVKAAVQSGELTQAQALDLLDAFQDHEFEAMKPRRRKPNRKALILKKFHGFVRRAAAR